MLNELKELEYLGSKEAIFFFLNIIKNQNINNKSEIREICFNSIKNNFFNINALFKFYKIFKNYISNLNDDKNISWCISNLIIKELFEKDIFKNSMFSFDIFKNLFLFHHEMLPLVYSGIRDILVEFDFFIVEKKLNSVKFFVNQNYNQLLNEHCRAKTKKISLKTLQKQLISDAIAGQKAEEFVLNFEKKRLKNFKDVKIISGIDVGAGYDIASFNDLNAKNYNRFIEVKAVSKDMVFYFSANEYKISKILAEQYFVYLVDICSISVSNYTPIIIQNPAKNIFQSLNYIIEPNSFKIQLEQ